jgi:hypothetical protein
MAISGPITGFNIIVNGTSVDIGTHYLSKDYLIDAYPTLIPSMITSNVFTWGKATSGTLGTSDIVHRSSPIQVGALTN